MLVVGRGPFYKGLGVNILGATLAANFKGEPQLKLSSPKRAKVSNSGWGVEGAGMVIAGRSMADDVYDPLRGAEMQYPGLTVIGYCIYRTRYLIRLASVSSGAGQALTNYHCLLPLYEANSALLRQFSSQNRSKRPSKPPGAPINRGFQGYCHPYIRQQARSSASPFKMIRAYGRLKRSD